MNKVFLELVKIQLTTAYLPMINMFNKKKKNQVSPPITNNKISLNGNQVLAILLMGYIFVNVCFFIGIMSAAVLSSIEDISVIWSFMSFIYVASILFSIFGSVFAAKSYMFDAKDNELLFSMPIKSSTILLSRLFTLYILDCVFSIIVIIPAGIVYALMVGFSIVSFIFYMLSIILLPVLATAICAILGFVFGFIASKISKITLVTSILRFAAFGLYFLFIFNLNNIINTVGNNIVEIASFIRSYFPPAYWFGIAVAQSNLLYIFISLLIFIVPSLLIFYFISRNFIKLATSKPNIKYSKYSHKPMKKQNLQLALLKKELSKIFSSSSYTFNCISGSFFALLVIGVVIVQGSSIIDFLSKDLSQFLIFIPIVVAATSSLFCSLNNSSAPSISLEAKTLWILKSNPVPFKKMIIAKALTVPVVSAVVILALPIVSAIIFNISIVDTVLIIIIALLSSFVAGFLGVYANLLFPKFDWVNEAIAIKQGASVFIAFLGGMVITNIPITIGAIVLFLSRNNILSLSIVIFIMLIFLTIELFLLKNNGKKHWDSIESN